MACYIALYDFKECDKETGRPYGLSLPIPFSSQKEAQEYLDEHPELWKGSPLFSYGLPYPINELILKRWDDFCKKIEVSNPLNV